MSNVTVLILNKYMFLYMCILTFKWEGPPDIELVLIEANKMRGTGQ